MNTAGPAEGALSAVVRRYDGLISELVRHAKEPGFTEEDWAPLAELIAVEDFRRVGILREEMTWADYVGFLTRWARAKDFWTRVRRLTEVPPLVFYEAEEHHLTDGTETIINSLNVFEFDEAGKIRHLDVYVQGQLYAPGPLPAYVDPG